MEIISMRSTSLDKEEGNVGNSTIISEILERIRPEEHTQSPQEFKCKSHC
jgi:hypothetical protein